MQFVVPSSIFTTLFLTLYLISPRYVYVSYSSIRWMQVRWNWICASRLTVCNTLYIGDTAVNQILACFSLVIVVFVVYFSSHVNHPKTLISLFSIRIRAYRHTQTRARAHILLYKLDACSEWNMLDVNSQFAIRNLQYWTKLINRPLKYGKSNKKKSSQEFSF